MKYILAYIFFISNAFALEPDYIIQGRGWLSRWGEIYCIKTYSLGETNAKDVNDSLDLFNYSDAINSLVYDDKPRDAIFNYIDRKINEYGNLSNGKHLGLVACTELSYSESYKALIREQDNYLYQNNAGIGAVIRAYGQKSPFSGTWKMISKYESYDLRHFNKGDVFPMWKSQETSGYEWLLVRRDDGGAITLRKPYF